MELKSPSKKTAAGLIPGDWDVTTVGDEFTVELGKMLDSERNLGSVKPFLGNRSVQWGRIDMRELGSIRMSKADLVKYRLKHGDLLVCEGGEVGRAAIWNAPIEECYYQKALHRLRPIRGYNSHYMLAVLEQLAKNGGLENFVTQTSIAHLPKEKFVNVPIPCPPPVEQLAIATALGNVDALLSAQEALIEKKRVIKQGVMQELLTGKRRLPGFSGDWEVKQLGEVATFLKGKGLPKSALSESGAEPCIHYGELFTRHPESISQILSFTDRVVDAFRSVANDVLMPTSDVTPRGLARASCVNVDGIILGGDILVIRPDAKRIFGPFLSFLIRYEETQVLQLVTGSTVFHLYGSDMKKFTFAMPPVDEQKAITEALNEMTTEIMALETKRAKTALLRQGMMQELLTGKTRLA